MEVKVGDKILFGKYSGSEVKVADEAHLIRKTVTAGANPMALKRGIDKAVEAVIAEITKPSN